MYIPSANLIVSYSFPHCFYTFHLFVISLAIDNILYSKACFGPVTYLLLILTTVTTVSYLFLHRSAGNFYSSEIQI